MQNITKLNKLDLEKLLIHVLSIGLIEGYIDEPKELFFIKSLKPRDLDRARLKQLKENFENWSSSI